MIKTRILIDNQLFDKYTPVFYSKIIYSFADRDNVRKTSTRCFYMVNSYEV